MIQLESFVVTIIGDLAVLLTFGMAFPPLAVVICCSIVGTTYVQKLIIGRAIYEIRTEQKHRLNATKSVNAAIRSTLQLQLQAVGHLHLLRRSQPDLTRRSHYNCSFPDCHR